MDRNSIIALVLIAIIVIIWSIWTSQNAVHRQIPPPKEDTTATTKSNENIQDSLATPTNPQVKNDSLEILEKYGTYFVPFLKGEEKFITIENDLAIAKISSKGGVLKSIKLKDYKSWNGYPVQLVWSKFGVLSITLSTREAKKVDTRDLYFKFDENYPDYIKISGNQSSSLSLSLEIQPGKKISRKYTFYGNQYHFDTYLNFTNLEDILKNEPIEYRWNEGLRYQEGNSVDESNDAKALFKVNGEEDDRDAHNDDPVEKKGEGRIDYLAIKNKYFLAAILPQNQGDISYGYLVTGRRYHVEDQGIIEKYNVAVQIPYKSGDKKYTFRIFVGPLHYDLVSQYGLEASIELGWKFIVRPIGEFFMLPIFKLIHQIIPNFGIAIIIFSILMKIILYPLSISQMRSTQKMQLIAPEVNALREKYKDEPQKQQQETMKLYSQYGINPMGGCLPLLLQMPILYALWAVLRGSIDLRQAHFMLWITDLSLPDVLFHLPFSFLGLKFISGLALLMGITLFFQQKMTITDPRQKTLIYIMPIMFTLLFSNFPSGLNLYYFMFNLLSIGQQIYINKYSRKKLTLEDLKKMPKKEGWFQKKMREAQEMAESQGRSVPGMAGMSYKNQQSKKKQSSGKSQRNKGKK
ncbi:MAG: membrane protein insertase YidC [Candidatus Kapabacteria bacterium]|nr:membrane protein insertase YidC [Candidatus Kapabacteria bacterium]